MSTLINRAKILAALSFLFTVSKSFSSELASLIKPADGSETKVRMTRHTVFVRKKATNASSTWRILTENTKKIAGVSSIQETKLPKNQAVVFDKIAIGYATSATDNAEGAVDYSSTKAPAALRNAVLTIAQNGREVLELPVADMVKVTSPTKMEDYYHDLEGFNYLVDDQPMEWTLTFPDGQSLAPSAAGNQEYIEVRLQGFKTIRKA